MNCNEAWRLLSASCDGELDLGGALALEEHAASCARCRRSLAALRAVRGAVNRSCAIEAAPASLRAEVRRSIGSGRGLRERLRSPLVLAAPGIAALALALWLAAGGAARAPAPAPDGTVRVVYHISSSDTASAALRSLGNHLQASPGVRVVVVAHSNGVDFLLRGARDESGRPYEETVRSFAARGVEFRVCSNTLERRRIAPGEVIAPAALVPSGIAEIERLQRSGRYLYLRL